MLVSPTQNCGVGGLSQRRGPNTNGFASLWNIGSRLSTCHSMKKQNMLIGLPMLIASHVGETNQKVAKQEFNSYNLLYNSI